MAFGSPPMRILVEVSYKDPSQHSNSPELYDGVTQILMVSNSDLMLTYGSKVISIPYAEIKYIGVNFIGPEGEY